MDIFNTTITAGAMIIQYLSACSEFSSDAKALKAGLEWDLRALTQAQKYFSSGEFEKGNQYREPDEVALMERTAEYLNFLVHKVHKSLHKIERGDRLSHTINMTTWIARRSQIQGMAREIHEWTGRFDVRVLSLPGQVRTSISAADGGKESIRQSSIIGSGDKLQEFLALSSTAKIAGAKDILLQAPDGIIAQLKAIQDISSLPFRYGDCQVTFCSREVPAECRPGTSDFEMLVRQMGELAAALTCLDPDMDVRLLKVNYYFYHPDSNQFLFAQALPYNVHSIMTLQEYIKYDPFPGTKTTLNERLKLAYKLSESIFFLHTAGFLHKNITSRSVVILRRFTGQDEELCIPTGIDEAYLMGFDLIRGVDAKTYKEGTRNEHDNASQRNVWDFDIFQHPVRLQGDNSPRYIKAHDVYSLGVVLLELGFWQPLPTVVGLIDQGNPSHWANFLLHIAPGMRQRVGARYHRVVDWCLSLEGDHDVKNIEFMQKVLDPLEEIMNVLA
ncbi:uncharacterized protein GGS22DRAFT_197666 [Annulohypoxylon maeteangense]|uniref:uncharacterized protein n=1 Tax=Annulohypoxylon maeteangense TaxID=1927788 RepID=UPI002007C468|nr:uncharacterized protein GGS22DRAFT_197666 [Annulohypoxylon maeteangense]KAI0880261.1 hypothetical protein GGS22DRAFT_197666 [Annulohypoxylon maeteangense]